MYKKISDYGLIGNHHSVALVGLDASIDWLCLPYIDSPSISGALLDDRKGGRFSINPIEDGVSSAEYLKGTNILRTTFRTGSGVARVTDFMPIPLCGEEELEQCEHELYRLVEVVKGRMDVGMVFDPQFDYARSITTLQRMKTTIIALGNGQSMVLSCSHPLHNSSGAYTAKWTLSAEDRLWLHLRHPSAESTELDTERAEKSLHATKEHWQNWLKRSETGRKLDLGLYQNMIDRCALVLKLLYYSPTGAIAAAATTSLPEEIGGARNWDYRYTWVRDTSFTLHALFNLGHLSETEGYLRWIESLISKHGAGNLQIMYGLRGEQNLPETELTHLDGYQSSRPVRIGNEAAKQKQLDIHGEIMDAALKLSDYIGKIDLELWLFLRDICDYVVDHWQEKDSGIWEVRGGPYHFVYSKVMCWVALDRGITIAQRYAFHADLAKWKAIRTQIKEEVMEKGWSEKKDSFVQHYDSDNLDASSLLIPIVGFLPFNHPRVLSTLEALKREVCHKDLLYRYVSEDGLQGGEGVFLLCTFWLIDCLTALKRFDEAEALLKRMEEIANHLGLFSEEYDVDRRESLGNFPQAFTHIGYINSVVALLQAKVQMGQTSTQPSIHSLLAGKIILNDGEPRSIFPPEDIARELKNSMNLLRGAFFDTENHRVAYERMRNSETYRQYVQLSYNLKNVDLDNLRTRQEQLAFWINLYNIIVIHAVVELGIKDSVKEVRNFFKRIQYQIGDMFFSPDDIEHGILRGNRRPPNSLFKLFRDNDKRLQYVISPFDPRIHFALVCASTSCPPIAVYTSENIEKELTVAGNAFLFGDNIKVDRERKVVFLSRIFKWYTGDFGKTKAERLKFIAPFLYDSKDMGFLEENAETLKIIYQDYDWRLNRY